MDENIIVVDDDRNLLESVRRVLVTSGFQNVKIESDAATDVKAGGDLNLEATANMKNKAGANLNVEASAQCVVKGAIINLN